MLMSLCRQTNKQLKIELFSLWTGRQFAIQLSFNQQIVEGALRGISNGELKSPQLEFAFVMHLYLFCKSNLKYFPVICPAVIVLCICIGCICIYICIWVGCRAEAAAVDLPAGRRLMRRPVRPLLLLQSASPPPPPPPTSAPVSFSNSLNRVGWPLPASAAASLYLHHRHQPRGRQRLFSKYTEVFGVNLCQLITYSQGNVQKIETGKSIMGETNFTLGPISKFIYFVLL